jgi:chemotaxis protein CheC
MIAKFGGAEREAVGAIVNTALGHAAASLSDLAGNAIGLAISSADFITLNEFAERLYLETADVETVAVRQCFRGALCGEALMVLPQPRALGMVRAMLGRESPLGQLTELEEDALTEVGNIVLNACLAGLADRLDLPVEGTLPVFLRGDNARALVPGGHVGSGDGEPVLCFYLAFTLAERVFGFCIGCAIDRDSAVAFAAALRARISGPAE